MSHRDHTKEVFTSLNVGTENKEIILILSQFLRDQDDDIIICSFSIIRPASTGRLIDWENNLLLIMVKCHVNENVVPFNIEFFKLLWII